MAPYGPRRPVGCDDSGRSQDPYRTAFVRRPRLRLRPARGSSSAVWHAAGTEPAVKVIADGVWAVVLHTSLEPHETPVACHADTVFPDLPSDPERDKHFRHSCWRAERRRVASALVASGLPESRVFRFSDCGSNAYVYASIEIDPSYRLVANFCRDRFCQPCARARAGLVARNLLAALPRSKLRFITLTLKHQIRSLEDTIDHLYKSFRRLRHRPFWKQRVRGGVAFCEIKWSPKTTAWNVHLHVLVDSDFLVVGTLSSEWHNITGDSFVVDIRLVTSMRSVASYVVKYASKGLSTHHLPTMDLLVSAIGALRGRRLCLPFGTWARINLSAVDNTLKWQLIASLTSIRACAGTGDPEALAILAAVTQSHSHDEVASDARDPPLFRHSGPLPDVPIGWHSRMLWI